MRSIHRTVATLAVAVLVAACGGTGAATTPGTTAAAASQAAALCTDVTEAAPATDVATAVKDFTWQPVSAKVGQVITWKNDDTAPHGVQTDEAGCKMSASIAVGQTRSLTFSKAGTYTFFCFIHSSMKGTITIS